MSTLNELHDIYQTNGKLMARFEAALVKKSWDIFNEEPSTENHTNRTNLAKLVIASPQNVSKKYYRYFLSDTTIHTKFMDSTDSEIMTATTNFLNPIANAEAQ